MTEEVVKSDSPQTASSKKRPGLETATLSLLLWLVVLGFGGGLLSMYYARIGYFPEVSWEQSLSYLTVLSILGGAVVIAYSLLLMAPGFIWSVFLVYDDVLQSMLCWGKDGKTGQPCTLSVYERLVGPFTLFILSVHASLLLEQRWWQICLVFPFWMLLVARFYYHVMVKIRCSQETGQVCDMEGKEKDAGKCIYSYSAAPERKWRQLPRIVFKSLGYHRDCRSIWMKYTVWFGSSLLLGWFSLAIIYAIASPTNKWSLGSISMLLICTVSVALANMAFVLLYKHNIRMAFGAVIAIALALLALGESISSDAAFSSRIMARFGFGTSEEYSVILNKKGRDLIMGFGLPFGCFDRDGVEAICHHGACRQEISNTAADAKVNTAPAAAPILECADFEGARIKRVRILSRLGSQYVVEMGDFKFSLPKEYVISWLTDAEDRRHSPA